MTRLRVASYNASLSRDQPGRLKQDIQNQHPQVVATVNLLIQLNADIILLNEFDYSEQAEINAAGSFVKLINTNLPSEQHYTYYDNGVNTGMLSPIDFNKDYQLSLPTDGYGFGDFPGQYGMLLLYRQSISINHSRTFQYFLWSSLSNPRFPSQENGQAYFDDKDKSYLRLSSKSHWDISLELTDGTILHCLASHPTPPVFDGKERRNYHRNAAEIQFWIDYLNGEKLQDDNGVAKSFDAKSTAFVLLGDLNSDPEQGDGDHQVIKNLLHHPYIQDTTPSAPRFSSGKPYTAKFSQSRYRVDYVLSSSNITVIDSGVYWHPKNSNIDHSMHVEGKPISDHYPVWIDISISAHK